MSVSVSIHPSSDRLVVVGEPDASASYSLSGYVEICISPSFLSRRRPLSLALHSLVLTFDGQCETVSSQTGYHAARVCSITQELISCAPIELDTTGYEDEPCRWRVIFDLLVPGWLPASAPFSFDDDLGTRYALCASARFMTPEEDPVSNWSLLNLCMPWFSRPRIVQATKDITIERVVHLDPSSSSTCLLSSIDNENGVKSSILSELQVLASTPKYIDIASTEIPLTLRVRAKGPRPAGENLRVKSIHTNFLQTETTDPRFLNSYKRLLPPQALQPPNLPLLRPHPVSSLYDLGLDTVNHDSFCQHSHSFLPSQASEEYALTGDTAIHPIDNESPNTWLTLALTVPFVTNRPSKDYNHIFTLQPSCSQPLYSIQHSLEISLTCSYVDQDEKPLTEVYKFSVPIRMSDFVQETNPIPSNATSTNTLPPYSQLFYNNGEQRTDNIVPLPLYSPTAEPVVEDSTSSIKLLNTTSQDCQ